ncbi:MAG: hypothetical protein Q7R49_02740 [Candidatus Daviesbacteria bacterium]|nr:hypothetical protein [Candidatus Daviesbacteria bacterium]
MSTAKEAFSELAGLTITQHKRQTQEKLGLLGPWKDIIDEVLESGRDPKIGAAMAGQYAFKRAELMSELNNDFTDFSREISEVLGRYGMEALPMNIPVLTAIQEPSLNGQYPDWAIKYLEANPGKTSFSRQDVLRGRGQRWTEPLAQQMRDHLAELGIDINASRYTVFGLDVFIAIGSNLPDIDDTRAEIGRLGGRARAQAALASASPAAAAEVAQPRAVAAAPIPASIPEAPRPIDPPANPTRQPDWVDMYVSAHPQDAYKMKHLLEATGRAGIVGSSKEKIDAILRSHGIISAEAIRRGFNAEVFKELCLTVGQVDKDLSKAHRGQQHGNTGHISPVNPAAADNPPPHPVDLGVRGRNADNPLFANTEGRINFFTPTKLLLIAQTLGTEAAKKIIAEHAGEIAPASLQTLAEITHTLQNNNVVIPQDQAELRGLIREIEADLSSFGEHTVDALNALKEQDPSLVVLSLLRGQNGTTPVQLFKQILTPVEDPKQEQFNQGPNTLTEAEIFYLSIMFRNIFAKWADNDGTFQSKEFRQFSFQAWQTNEMHTLVQDMVPPEVELTQEMVNGIYAKFERYIDAPFLLTEQNPKSVHVLFGPLKRIKDREDLRKALRWCFDQHQKVVRERAHISS